MGAAVFIRRRRASPAMNCIENICRTEVVRSSPSRSEGTRRLPGTLSIVCLSIGIEKVEDLIEALDAAFEAVKQENETAGTV